MENLKKIGKIITSPALSAILTWAKPVRWSVMSISSISVVGTMVALGMTLVTKALVDAATGGNVIALWQCGIWLIVFYALQRGLSVWMSFLQVRTSANLQKYLQNMVTKEILGKEYGNLKSFHSGGLTNRVFSDVSVVKSGIMNLFPTFLQTAVSFIGAAIILIRWDWKFVTILIVAALIGSGVTLAFRKPMKRRHKRMQTAADALYAKTQETLENIRLIKASVSENRVIGNMDKERELLVSEQVRNGRLSIAFNSGMGVVFDISRLLCYLWGCVKIYN